jgi:ribose transport system permease protein
MSLEDTINKQTYSWFGRLVGHQAFWVFVAAVIACAVLSLASDVFATQQNLFNITRNFAFVGIIALGMTIVIITGGIDLSVGSVLCLSAMILGVLMNAGFSFWIAAIAALGASALVGAVNGFLIAVVGIPSFVATLGMLSVARSLAMVVSNNRMVYQFGPDHDFLLGLGGGATFHLANPVWFLAVLAVVAAVVLRWSRWGLHVFAIGGNEQAAVLTGVAVRNTKISVYVISSLAAGFAGILEVGWLGGVTTNLGQSMELAVIAATVIGGANLAGGRGTVVGAVVGAALIEVIRNSLILLGISTFWQGTFVGTFIVIAVVFDRLKGNRQSD